MLGKLYVAALFLIATAKIAFSAVCGARTAGAHYEIVRAFGFNYFAAEFTLYGVFDYFLQISPEPFPQLLLPKL